ncbi:hypothetical protein DOTSEDRAFT_73374 [Lecanosticta acicola]|uniref:Tho complex subunit 7 n=1 Tax=Lecanosticta acicola TaxID=111012 RepID=A0AAI9E8T0_9PEZI|nr:hypothetical protein DOTSEDRAFT_73374 [Lecanosticta acicola]
MADQDVKDLQVLPDQAQEDDLHAKRLLAIEDRPFTRVTKKLFGENSILRSSMNYLPSPPPDGESDDELANAYKIQKFREDVLIDFANLENSLIRIQLIFSSNQRQRERYAAEKAKILETAQAVRDNTVELRAQLVEAQRVLEQRKGYDEQAAKILDDKKLKSRDETKADIEKLEKEIEDLQHESAEYEGTWVSRREQFDSIVREGDAMIRLIKGIKDEPEPEKDEEMEDAEDGTKAEKSRTGTPAPEGRSPRHTDTGDATPMREGEGDGDVEGGTPRNKFLEIEDGTRPHSRVSSPLVQPTNTDDDVDMAETNLSQAPSTENQDPPNSSDGAQESEQQSVATPMPDVAME